MPAKPARTRLSRDERRREIILGSIAVFARNGFHAATTSEIARSCGVSEALLYQHFDSKKELFIASMELTGKAVLERLRPMIQSVAADPRTSAAEQSARLIGFMDKFLHDHPTLAKMSLMMLAETDDPQIRRAVGRLFSQVVDVLAKTYSESQKRGRLRSDVDPKALGWLNVGVFQLMALLTMLEPEVRFDRAKLRSLAKAFILAQA